MSNSSLKRRSPFKESNRLILVVCEGEVTEVSYFKEFPRYERIHGIQIDPIGVGCDPETVVNHAIKKMQEKERKSRKGSGSAYDEIWAVFDIDEHDKDRVYTAKRNAEKHGINIAISNPCFEIWLLMHLEDSRSYVEGSELTKRIRRYYSDYKKYLCYSYLQKGRKDAYRRAIVLDNQHKREGTDGNPSSDMWKFLESIIKKEDL